jgi:hypothetical protein
MVPQMSLKTLLQIYGNHAADAAKQGRTTVWALFEVISGLAVFCATIWAAIGSAILVERIGRWPALHGPAELVHYFIYLCALTVAAVLTLLGTLKICTDVLAEVVDLFAAIRKKLRFGEAIKLSSPETPPLNTATPGREELPPARRFSGLP